MATDAYELDAFTRAYVEAALWSSTGDDGKPLDDGRDVSDVSPECLERMKADCAKFQADNAELITAGNAVGHVSHAKAISEAGHDFWLTRNGHGAGFWDGGWEAEAGAKLTEASKAYREFNLYVGDDGLIHGN
jgi:hypothetical protein